jgi:hypothetical protein
VCVETTLHTNTACKNPYDFSYSLIILLALLQVILHRLLRNLVLNSLTITLDYFTLPTTHASHTLAEILI